MKEFKFSLDIGTRKVAAFITTKSGETVEAVHCAVVPHKSRAVRAGQIHDIDSVAQTVLDIKQKLESNTGFEINKVATAIAGRNLKTYRSTGYAKFDSSKEILHKDMKNAELSAIQAALSELDEEINDYYFAGHTTVGWEIDGEPVSHPMGHFARELKTELISTFLPRRVLESLFSVLKKTGLELSYLTLEPIAACESVLPRSMRNIPVILVDIGAGTSDIAMISQGSVQDFAMIPVAGDFITEGLSSELLLDFNEAERVKTVTGTSLRSGANTTEYIVSYKNIFNKEFNKSSADISEVVRPSVKILCEHISSAVKNSEFIKKHANYAVVLVGGGALSPFIEHELSIALNIPAERIGIRTPEMVDKFSAGPLVDRASFGPQSAVALGAAFLSHENYSINIMHATVNEKKVELLNFADSCSTVLSALLSAGISKNEIYGKPGLAKTYTLNGQPCMVKGEMPSPARIQVDCLDSELNAPLKDGSKINFSPARNGRNAFIQAGTLGDGKDEFVFSTGGQEKLVRFPGKILVNDVVVSNDYEINDRDIVKVETDFSMAAALNAAGVSIDSLAEENISVNVFGDTVTKTIKNFMLTHNGSFVSDISSIHSIMLSPGDRIECEMINPVVRVGDFVTTPPQGNPLKIKINGEEFVFPGSLGKVLLNGKDVDETTQVNDGDIIRTMTGRDAEAALVDIFKYISVDPNDTVGKRLKLFVNCQEAAFTTPLAEGADVKISFE